MLWVCGRSSGGKPEAAVWAVASVCLLLLVGCTRPPSGLSPLHPIRIGLIVPLSSGVPAAAQSVVQGAQLAAAEINAEKGIQGRRLTLTKVDDFGHPAETTRLFALLVGEEVVAVVGALTDATAIAAAAEAERFGVVLISPGATGALPYGGHFVFRTALPARTQAGTMARHLVETLNARRIAIVHDSNEYGTSVAEAFAEGVKIRQAIITSRRLYRDGDTDFTRHVRGVLGERAEALFLAGYPDEGALVLRQLRAVAPDLIVAGSDALYSDDILTWAGAAADKLYVPAGFAPNTSLPLVRNFVTRFREEYRRPPDQFAAQAYDAVRVLAYAMRRAGPQRGRIRNALVTVKRFPGVTGELAFDRWGDPARDVIITQVKGGTFVPLTP